MAKLRWNWEIVKKRRKWKIAKKEEKIQYNEKKRKNGKLQHVGIVPS